MSSSNVRAAAAAAVAIDWTVATLIIIIILAARKNKINHNLFAYKSHKYILMSACLL
jgi:hypothetical protein